MTITIPQLAKKMQDVLKTKADELAWETGFMERERVLTGSSFVVGLVSGWQSNPQMSLAGLSQAISNAGTPISRQGLHERFTAAAVELMRGVLEESLQALVSGTPLTSGIIGRFSRVELVDSSIVTLPNTLSNVWQGSGGYGENASTAALKISVRWDMRSGQVAQLNLSDGRAHDRRAAAHEAPVEPNSLQLRDLGYFKLDDLAHIGQQGAFWLMKYKVGTHVFDQDHHPIDLSRCLPQRDGQRLDQPVYLGQRKQLPCRLIAERVPDTVAQQRQANLREIARRSQKPVSERSLTLTYWTIYLTNLSTHQLTTNEVFIMGRYRWQIELLFKLWKSHLQIDEWRTNNPYRILAELYAKLVAVIVTHWFLLMACWDNPRRSLVQAMPTIHGMAWQWANSLSSLPLLEHALRCIRRALSRCQMDKSNRHPRHFQLLEVPCA